MSTSNPWKEALTSGRFSYIVELVASAKTPEATLLDTAAQLAQVPGVVAGSITSYAGGSMGHDPIRIGTAARARGLTPNIHLTCVNRDREGAHAALEELHALGLENVFALSGDYPQAGKSDQPAQHFAMDSVQLVSLISEMRQAGMPFWIGVAVSPFKYSEADCVYQYLKLEKKVAAGANYAITQLGFDSRKYAELKRYADEHNLGIPLVGSAYALPPKQAEAMAKGKPPGCWVSPELLERVREEAKAPDKGQAAKLERAARLAAILKGLGYAGAYIGGDHHADRVRWIIRRAEELAPQWEQCAEEISYGPKGGFFYYGTPAREPAKRKLVPRVLDTMGKMFPVKKESALQSSLAAVCRWIDKRPKAEHALERLEFAVKSPMFGCQACGNCVLGLMEYVCPMTCPKGMRNGPCGGTLALDGQCEVVDQKCIWNEVYDRAKAAGRVDDLKVVIPPRNLALQGTSSWINFFLKRDSRPENPPTPFVILHNDAGTAARQAAASGGDGAGPGTADAVTTEAQRKSDL